MRRARLVLLFLLGAVSASVVGLTVAPAALATDPFPNTIDYYTAGYSDPAAAYEAGALPSGANTALAERIAGVDTDGIAARIASTITETDYAGARIFYAGSRAGILPDLVALATADEGAAFLPLLGGTIAGVGLLAIGGYLTYKYVWNPFGGGGSKTIYINFDRAELGGAYVTVPGDPYTINYDYKAAPSFGWLLKSNVTDTYLNSSYCSSSAPCWVFNYRMDKQQYNTSTKAVAFDDSSSSTSTFLPHSPWMPKFDDCVGTLATCYTTLVSGSWIVNKDPQLTYAIAEAADQTYTAMRKSMQADWGLKYDGDAEASGHILNNGGGGNVACGNGSFPYAYHCQALYIKDAQMEQLLPRTVTTTPPAGADVRGSVGTFTSGDPSSAGAKSAIAGALDGDACGRAIMNFLLDPHDYPYPGCAPGHRDPGAGSTTVAPPAPTPTTTTTTTPVEPFAPFVLPEPQPWQTYRDYLAELRAKGWVGTATTTLEPIDVPGLGPSAVSAITVDPAGANLSVPLYDRIPWDGLAPAPSRQTWPDNPPNIPTADTAVAVRINPPDAPPIYPSDTGCNCPSIHTPGLDTSGKFPFGVWDYIHNVFTTLVTDPVRPQFVADVAVPYANHDGKAADAHGTLAVKIPDNWDTQVDGWFATWRQWLGYGMWIAGILWVAFWFFKLQHPALYEDEDDESARLGGAKFDRKVRRTFGG